MREVHSIENRLGRPQLRDQIVFRSHDNATILGLVAAGVGAAILSWLSVDPHRPGLCFERLVKVSRAAPGPVVPPQGIPLPGAAVEEQVDILLCLEAGDSSYSLPVREASS
jgi:DNA-binding transcriptional LysR family regulator